MTDEPQTIRILQTLSSTNVGGLNAIDIAEKLPDIPKNSLATTLWQLKKDGLIHRLGGARGRWRYGLTHKGREQLDPPSDPLARLVREAKNTMPEGVGFDAMLSVVESLDDYKLLRRFTGWLFAEQPDLIREGVTQSDLNRAIFSYMGIDIGAFNAQKKALESLLNLV